MFNDLVGTMPNRDPAEEQARQIIERLGLGGQIPAFNQSLPQTGGYGGPATPMPGMSQQPAYTGGLTPEQSAMVMGATDTPEQQAYGMVNRLLGSTQADAFANRDKNAAYNMISNHPALGQAQADAFMNRGTVNRQPDYYGLGAGLIPNYDEFYLKGTWGGLSSKPGPGENQNMMADRPAPNLGAGLRGWGSADPVPSTRPPVVTQQSGAGVPGWMTDDAVSRPSGIVGNAINQMLPPGWESVVNTPLQAQPSPQQAQVSPQMSPQNTGPGFFGQLGIDATNSIRQNPLNQAIDDITSGVIKTNADYQNQLANSNVPSAVAIASTGTIDTGIGASEAARGGAWGGIQGNPFYMGERPAPGHQLGYTGSFMGSSRGWTDDSEGRAWDARAARNLEINRMLGNQELGRQANATDAFRTMMNVDQRRESSLDRKEGKMWDTISKTPEGQRKGIIAKGILEGVIPQDVGKGMMVDEVLKRSTTGTRSKEGVINMPAFLAKLQSEWDPTTMDGNLLIEKLQALGVTPDMVDRYKTDPAVGAFAQRLLGPPVVRKTYGLEALGNNMSQGLSGIGSKLSRLIYGE